MISRPTRLARSIVLPVLRLKTICATAPNAGLILSEYERVVAGYPLSLAQQQPPEGALDRLLERARSETATSPPPPQRSMRYLWASFAALAALLLVMLGWNLWLQFDTDDDYSAGFQQYRLSSCRWWARRRRRTLQGICVLDKDSKNGALVASGLPVLSAERDYQLWFVHADGTRDSGGVFHPDALGQITVQVIVPDNSERRRSGRRYRRTCWWQSGPDRPQRLARSVFYRLLGH